MPEQQNIEYKLHWHDDYLKWICGFANAQGGTIFIGIDDKGNVVGIENYKELMDDIPNKVRNLLGITVEVDLKEIDNRKYVQIEVMPYSVPISLRGRYYYRSGSTKQELIGAALNEFLLKKSGQTWDDVIEPRASIADIDESTVNAFVELSNKAGRLPESGNLNIKELLEKLRLIENGRLKRGALILFGKDPGRFYPNTFVKIGRFGSTDTDLLFHEIVEGNLIQLVQFVQNQLNHKFLIRPISFEGFQRIEKEEYPVAAIREMLLNALVHRNYMGAATQIRVYDDKISIWNYGALTGGLTEESLKRTHSSNPRNPIVADVCFKGGLIDAWGRGTLKIIETCKQAELPEPELKELDGGFLVSLFKNKFSNEQPVKHALSERQLKAVSYVKERGWITNTEYQVLCGVSKATSTRDLKELTDKFNVFKRDGTVGSGTKYSLIDS